MKSQNQDKPPIQRSNVRSLSTRIVLNQKEKSSGDMDNGEQPESASTHTKTTQEASQIQSFNHIIDLNPQDCEQYCQEIFIYWMKQEGQYLANSSYMQQQPEISEKMRLHEKFKLQPETLHLTVHILDRFLSVELVTKKKLQLLGVASLMIACKYEEIYPPDLQDFLYVTKNSYSQEEILKQERKVLNTLKWRLTQPYSILYLTKFCSIFNFEKRQQHLIEYMLDLALLDYHMIKYPPSILSSSAIQLTLSLFKQPWPGIFQQLTNYTSQNLEECTLDLQALCQKAQLDQTFFKQIKKKYSQSDFSNVSRIQIGSNNNLESPPRHIKSNSQESQGLEQLTKKIQGISIAKSSNT